MSKKVYLTGILAILLLSFILRVYDLSNNPPGFFSDEAAIGYNAYKILQTGKDEYGNPFPIFFRSFGDYRLPVPIYANIPFIALFGLSEFGVRFTAVFYGLISILFIILIASEIFGKNTGLLAGMLTGILPWHIHMSRWGAEYIYFPALLSIGLYLFLRSFRKESLLVYAFIFFGLSLYTYYAALIVIPLLVLFSLIVWLVKKQLFSRQVITKSLIIFSLICVPIFFGIKSGILLTRWKSIDNPPKALNESFYQMLITYVNHYSPDFLFLKGDADFKGHFVTRHSVRGFGELYLFQLPLLMIGLITMLMKKKDPRIYLILFLLLIYPTGNAIALEGPFATKSIVGVIPFSIISALGLSKVLDLIMQFNNKAFKMGIAIIIFGYITVSLAGYCQALFKEYPIYSANYWGWQYGPKTIISYLLKERNNYDELYFSVDFNGPDIFLKFYDPEGECNNCKLGGIDDYSPKKKQLFSIRVEALNEAKSKNIMLEFKRIKTIYYPGGSEAFYIGEAQFL